jgi:hypothetical protein
VHGLLEDAHDAGRTRTERRHRREQNDAAEDEEQQRLGERAVDPVRKTEMTTIGQNSPATPAPSTAEPRVVGSRPASARIGTSVPSEVVLSATPSSQASASRPACSRTAPTPIPIAIDTAQPVDPSTSERRATRCSISSRPAKKNRNTRPRLARKSMWVSTFAQPSPCGPIRIPSAISSTTVGRTIRLCSLDRIAPALAAASTSTSEPASGTGTSAATRICGITSVAPA